MAAKKNKPIVVPRPPAKSEAGELMMSLDGLMMKYETHVREIIRFALTNAGMQVQDMDKAVDDIAPRWIQSARENLPGK